MGTGELILCVVGLLAIVWIIGNLIYEVITAILPYAWLIWLLSIGGIILLIGLLFVGWIESNMFSAIRTLGRVWRGEE